MSDETNDEMLTEADWKTRAEAAERALAEATGRAEALLKRAELKIEAVKAGMVDLDGLQLIDPAAVTLNENGEVVNATSIMSKLKRAKPWLFGGASSSSIAQVPRAETPRQRDAREMSEEEWRSARAALLNR
jgi:hypothetical protein